MAEAGLQEVDTYVSRLHNTVVQFIATIPIMDLFLVADRRPGSRVVRRWKEKDGLDLEGMRKTAQEVERAEREEDTGSMETEMD